MILNNNLVETDSVVVEQVNPYLVVCRYKPGAKVDGRVVQETVAARMSLPGEVPHAVVTVYPQDVSFEMSLFNRDHYKEPAVVEKTRALAFVVQDPLMESMVKMYFAYHPTPVAREVFQTERAALAWLDGKMGRREE